MKKIYAFLAVLFIALVGSCSLVEHDEKGSIYVQLDSGGLLSRINAAEQSRGEVAAKESFTAKLSVTNGVMELYNASAEITEKSTLDFSVPGLPVNSSVTVNVEVVNSEGRVYYKGSSSVIVIEGNVPVTVVLKYAGPAKPENPVEPDDPIVEPVEPEDPEDPIVEPVDPDDPIVEPVDPEDPDDPIVEPVDPDNPIVEPVDPEDPEFSQMGINVNISSYKLVVFKKCDTEDIYESLDLSEEVELSGEDTLKFLFVPADVELDEIDPESTEYVPASSWSYSLNGTKTYGGVSVVNPESVSLKTSGLNYGTENIFECTAYIDGKWYQAVSKFKIKQASRDENYNSYAFFVDIDGYLNSYDLNAGVLTPGEKVINPTEKKSFSFFMDTSKNSYLYRSDSSSANLYGSNDQKSMEKLSVNSHFNNDTYDGATLNWIENGSLALSDKIAYDSVTGKYWMFGIDHLNDNKCYLMSTDSLTEDTEFTHYDATSICSPLDFCFAVHDNYIVMYQNTVGPMAGFTVAKVDEATNDITSVPSNISIQTSCCLVGMQVAKSDIYLLYNSMGYTDYNLSHGSGDIKAYGFVSKLYYTGNSDSPYAVDEGFGFVGLSDNCSIKKEIKISDMYYSTDEVLVNYYGTSDEEAARCFFSPLYFAAIKDDYLYVVDDGFRVKDDSETGAFANRDRIMKISLEDKTVSVEKDGINVMHKAGASMPSIFEY